MKNNQCVIKVNFTPSNEILVSYKSEKKICGMHFHNFYEIDIIIDGEGTSNLNGKNIKFKKNTAFFLTPKDFHDIIPETNLKIINIQFSSEVLKECFKNTQPNGGYAFFDDDAASDITSICAILAKDNKKNSYRNALLTALIHLLFLHNESSVPYTFGKNAMRDIFSFVNDHYKENPSLEILSKLFDRTPNYISAQFTKIAGENYKSYLKRLKLDFALKMLVSTDLSITNICYESGYETISHFNREFKSYFGRAPRQIRTQQKNA